MLVDRSALIIRIVPSSCRRLHRTVLTFGIFVLQFDPLLEEHLEFLKCQVMGEPVSARTPLHEVVLMGGTLLNGSVQVDTVPA